jgi:hypothetical protein
MGLSTRAYLLSMIGSTTGRCRSPSAFRPIGAMTGRSFPAAEMGTVFHRSGCFPEAMNSPLYPNLAPVSDRSLRPGPFSHWPVFRPPARNAWSSPVSPPHRWRGRSVQSFEPCMCSGRTTANIVTHDWGGTEEKADQMRMFRVIALGFLLAAPIGAQAQGVPRGMNYGAHRGAYTGYSVLGPVGGFVGGVVGGAAGGVVGDRVVHPYHLNPRP